MRRLALALAATLAGLSGAAALAHGVAVAQTLPTFMVFFDAGSSTLSPQSRAILDNVASTYRTLASGQQVVLAGHTDDASKSAVKESQTRANAVREYLIAGGVPAGVITVEAFGAERPLVLVADGVAEAQNRRVEISFGPGSGW